MQRILLALVVLVFFTTPYSANAIDCPRQTVCAVGTTEFCTTSDQACRSSSPGARVVTSAPPGQTSPTDVPENAAETETAAGTLENPLQANSIAELLAIVLQAVVRLGTLFLVIMLVYVGFLFVAAQGKEEKIRDARSALMWTVIGGLILLGATAISEVIEATVNAL